MTNDNGKHSPISRYKLRASTHQVLRSIQAANLRRNLKRFLGHLQNVRKCVEEAVFLYVGWLGGVLL